MAEDDSRESDARQDVALVYAPTDDGVGARILRARNGAIEAGEIRPTKEGQPVNRGELVRLRPRADAPCVCDVEVLYDAGQGPKPEVKKTEASRTESARTGPAQVATEGYRSNWDRIFGGSAAGRGSVPN